MQQYLQARLKLEGLAVLLFRMGDFYEAFFDDAKIIAKELEITLTGRPENNYPGGRIPMAGVPAKAVKAYIAKLLESGYKVYIAEQMADPKTCKGLVPREITKIFTPGTISDLDLIDSYQNNFIAALYTESNDRVGLAYTDISTGEFYVSEFDYSLLEQELSRINAAEILVPSTKSKIQQGAIVGEDVSTIDFGALANRFKFSTYHQNNFDLDLARQNIGAVFEINSVEKLLKENLGMDSKGFGLRCAGAIIEYLKETQAHEFAANISKNFDTIKTYNIEEFLVLDSNTRRNLELVQNLNGNHNSSLFSVIDRTSSKMGRRALRKWLEQPLCNVEEINSRQNTIQELLTEYSISKQINQLLSETHDIDRLSSRLMSQLISPRELIALKNSLVIVEQISSLVQAFSSGLISSLKLIPKELSEFISQVDSAIKTDPNINITEGNIIQSGFNQTLDEYISLVEDSESWLNRFEEEERNKLNIKNLKVGFNKIHGYYIETSRLHESKLGDDYIIKQTMVNTIRAITPELKDFEEKITNAETRRNALEYQIFLELRQKLSGVGSTIKQIAQKISELDALISLTILAKESNYTRPEIDTSKDLFIIEGRHPVVESRLSLGSFVPNDIYLSDTRIMILTGPNMAGKSTYMRQNALIIILAQMGSFVPAKEARIGIVDRIFTRIGSGDDLASGQSTFMVEMIEAANILNSMTSRSFIILDEIGRGTSTYDGVAIAWSIVEYLARNLQSRTIFATHYHELANLDKIYNCIKNYQVLVSENPNSKSKIEFLHKVAEGSTGKSYGIEVARLAGLPKAVLDRARAINSQLQSNKNRRLGLNSRKSEETTDLDDSSIDVSQLPLWSA